MAYSRSRHRRMFLPRPFVAFLLVASFGILFAGCGNTPTDIPQSDSFTFTMKDLEKVKELVGNGTGAFIPRLEVAPAEEGSGGPPIIDVGAIGRFNAIRSGGETGEDLFRVNNDFLNIRSEPKVTAPQIGRLENGDTVKLKEFVNAAWAQIEFAGGDGFVVSRYISKLVSEQQLAPERKKYDGLYFVDFGFLNVRKSADSESEKIGELSGQSFVRPISKDEVWARIPYGEGDGYVARQYLTPFLPNFLVRQSTFHLPVIQYRLVEEGLMTVMPQHLAALKKEGYTIWTVRDFSNLLLEQEKRDIRLNPKTVILSVSDIAPQQIGALSDILRSSGVKATLFLQTKHLGDGAIDQKNIATLLANGHDLQSAGHTGDDLRSLTNAQVELELSQSKKLLEQATKQKVIAVAYPLGGVNDRIARKAADVGYLLGLSSASDKSFERTQLLRLPSVVVKVSTSAEDLLTQIAP